MASARANARVGTAAAVSAFLAVATLIGAATTATATVRAAGSGDVSVGSTPLQPAQIVAVGKAPAAATLDLDVVLRPRNPAALAAFVADVSTPASPNYRHYLPKGAFGSRFGATPQTIEAVRASLRARGLTVGAASIDGLSIPVTGTVKQVASALHTSFSRYQLKSGRTGLANRTPPQLPQTVAAAVQGIVGLNQLVQAVRTHPAASAISSGSAGPSPALDAGLTLQPALGPTACAAAVNVAKSTGGYTAGQIAHHYGLDALYPATLGAGVTIGVFELEPFNSADLATYQACYGTHTAVSVVPVAGGAGPGPGSGEAALDVEDVIGLAPGAKIAVYESPNNGANVYDMYRQISNEDTAQIVSDSWGLCEAEAGVADLAALERPLFQKMAAQGQTVLAATGDSGSEGCYAPPQSVDTTLSVWDPASQPEVTAIGGTSVVAAGAADVGWNDTFGASGGGISTLWQMPSYQRPVAVIPESTPTPCGATHAQLCREIPDISASADVQHGYVAYFGGAWRAVGGTSAATPTVAAMLGLSNALCATSPAGFLNPLLYQLAAVPTPNTLIDVATGPSNDFTGSNRGSFGTRAGFDLTTGIGRLSAPTLAGALCPTAAPNGSGSMSVSPALVVTSAMTTLSFTYAPVAGHGLIDGEIDITVPGTWSLPSVRPTDAGFTTASAGVVSIVGNTIIVGGITTSAGQPVNITYGDTTGGTTAAAPTTPQATTFATSVRTTKAGSPTRLASDPAVRVLTAGGTGAGQGTFVRVAGIDRTATSILASETAFPDALSAGAVVVARSDTFPDALAGVPLAAQARAPLLLSPTAGLTGDLTAEIRRVLSPGHTVFLLGGPTALATSIDTQLVAMGYLPSRIQGIDRYDTAVKIATTMGDPTTVFEADGTNFPDALSAGPAAIITHGAVLLTAGRSPAPATARYLAQHAGDTRHSVGGPAAAADPTAQPIVGPDRYATSVMIAQLFFTSPSSVGAASGAAFPDALSGGPVAGLAGAPLVLVPATGTLPMTTRSYFNDVASSVLSGWLFGGQPSVSTQVATEVAQALVLVPPAS